MKAQRSDINEGIMNHLEQDDRPTSSSKRIRNKSPIEYSGIDHAASILSIKVPMAKFSEGFRAIMSFMSIVPRCNRGLDDCSQVNWVGVRVAIC